MLLSRHVLEVTSPPPKAVDSTCDQSRLKTSPPDAASLLVHPKIVLLGLGILRFNVVGYHLIADISHRRHKTTSRPKMPTPELRSQSSILLQ